MAKKIFIALAFFLLIVIGAAAYGWYYFKSGKLEKKVIEAAVNHYTSSPAEMGVVQQVFGYGRPRTYLILLLNNTELRPGGGFIGAYAVVKVEEGKPRLVIVQGTEILDNFAPREVGRIPPAPLSKYLTVDRWWFRDSNWSPDFKQSAQTALDFYRRERGPEADAIDGVVGFTPTIFEELLKISGPITVAGEQFTSQNFTEKLEYEVEYKYAARGISFQNRKNIMMDLARAFLLRTAGDLFRHWSNYRNLLPRMLEEKQLMAYSTIPQEQKLLEAKGWAGTLSTTTGDYLLWTDANLGALKTDAVMERQLAYSVSATNSVYYAKATMHYTHHGRFDWRTSRYRDYVRIFVPPHSTLVGVTGAMDMDRSSQPGAVDEGDEGGYHWFGTFIAVEPGKEGTLSFHYRLSSLVTAAIQQGNYRLLVQKQLGTLAPQLTVRVDFDRKLAAARPGELFANQGDTSYSYQTNLRVDRNFEVHLGGR